MTDHNALVSPSYCLESRDVTDLLREFGPYEGRYVYQYPHEWRAQFLEHIEQLSDVEKLRIKTLIAERLDPVLLPVKAKYQDGASWGNNVRQNLRFQHTYTVGDALDPDGFKTWSEALEELHDSRARSWAIGGALQDFMTMFEPLFLKAPACYLIDRHFNPLEDKPMYFLSSLLDRLIRTCCYELHMITRYEAINEDLRAYTPDKAHFEKQRIREELRELYSTKIPQGKTLVFHLVREGREGGNHLRMHNRFFLTKHGALDISTGYKLLSQPHKQMTVHVVDKPLHDSLKSIYIDGVTRYHDTNLPKKESLLRPLDVDTVVVKNS